MSICAGCGARYHGESSRHLCDSNVVNIPEEQTWQQVMRAKSESTPTYITDILEALKRIEDLLREGK